MADRIPGVRAEILREVARKCGADEAAAERAADFVLHDPQHELLHENDCFACAVAFEVTGTLAPVLDPLENWDQVEAGDGLPGDTVYRQVERVVAYVLHRRLPGHTPAPAYPGGVDG